MPLFEAVVVVTWRGRSFDTWIMRWFGLVACSPLYQTTVGLGAWSKHATMCQVEVNDVQQDLEDDNDDDDDDDVSLCHEMS